MEAVWPLGYSLLGFAGAALAIGWAGPRLTRDANLLADRTGLGEAVTGAILLGAITSLPGIVTTVTAAWNNQPQFAISHAFGGIAAQTVFLVVADYFFRGSNLEHAAPSLGNMMEGVLLIALLALVLFASAGPVWTLWHVHPVSLLIPLGYVLGMRLASQAFKEPMWAPKQTRETVMDVPGAGAEHASLWRLALSLAGLGALVGAAGYVVARSGMSLVETTGLSATVVGGLFATLITSLPELVTTLAAVRQRALTLAIGGIIGGNAFDCMFAAIGDMAYREGSIYHTITHRELFLIAMTILMMAVLLLGLLRREKHGIINIGFEGVIILAVYVVGFLTIYMVG